VALVVVAIYWGIRYEALGSCCMGGAYGAGRYGHLLCLCFPLARKFWEIWRFFIWNLHYTFPHSIGFDLSGCFWLQSYFGIGGGWRIGIYHGLCILALYRKAFSEKILALCGRQSWIKKYLW